MTASRPARFSLADMRDIPKDIARVGGLGREARYLKPYLLAALDAAPPTHPLAAQARAVLDAWDGSSFADAITSTALKPGQVIFSTWITRMRNNTFGDELGTRVGEANANTLIHVLDDALGGGSGVPPTRDYFNGADPNAVMSAAFDQTLTSLGPNPAAWSSPTRGVINFNHPVVGNISSIPNSNRATYAQIVVLSRSKLSGESIFSLGQSGWAHQTGAAQRFRARSALQGPAPRFSGTSSTSRCLCSKEHRTRTPILIRSLTRSS